MFQSQTRRLLPRNGTIHIPSSSSSKSFNRRRDACFLATLSASPCTLLDGEFQSQTRRLLPRNHPVSSRTTALRHVSIADATLASSQLHNVSIPGSYQMSFNRRRDACFLATILTAS